MTIPFKKLKNAWMKDPAFRAKYDRLAPEYAVHRRRLSAVAAKQQRRKLYINGGQHV